MEPPRNRCLIWPCHEATLIRGSEQEDIRVDSPRCGVPYAVNALILDDLTDLSDTERVSLTSLLVEQRANGVLLPRISPGLILNAKAKRKLRVSERAERLLRYLADSSSTAGASIDLETHPGPARLGRNR